MKNKLDRMFESDFIRVPRPFIRRFNLNTAIMLSEIYSEYTYWKEQNGLQKGGWFFSTVENMYNNTGLSKHQQLIACKELEAYGIIKIKYHGMPKKRYFKFDTTNLNNLYSDFLSNSNQTDEHYNDEDAPESNTQSYSGFSGFCF
ncbi:MAG: hypothetical protein J6D06_05810 [Clostridia bacterium]|nr:hypothetical protein [Clostridia bacterium]